MQASAKRVDQYYQALDPWYWAYQQQIKLVGGPFALDGHEFQVRPMSISPPVKVIRKATQTTFTETEVLRCLHGLIHGLYPHGVLYLFPTSDEVTDFSSSRFNPLINDNPDSIGAHVRETNRTTLRRVGQGFIYFRSGRLNKEIAGQTKSSSHLKSVPADHAVHDEYDEMSPKIDEFVAGRLAKSDVGTMAFLANPTLPRFGISAKFDESDQEYWGIKCQHCSTVNFLDDPEERPFPEMLHETKDGKVIRACKKCQKALDPRFGDWVAKRPRIDEVIGFTIGHQSVAWIDPAKLLADFKHTSDIANFTRMKLGRPYLEAECQLSVDDVLACCADYANKTSDKGPCTMGIDQGKGLHVVIGKRPCAVLHVGEYLDWEQLDPLMKKFHVSRCVVDALPETRNARQFAVRHKGKVFLNYYGKQKGTYKWNEKELQVACNRTESLDASHQELATGKVSLPRRTEAIEEFARHCTNIGKKLIVDEEDGSRVYIYVPLGSGVDHYRHAYNYWAMANQYGQEGAFGGLDLS